MHHRRRVNDSIVIESTAAIFLPSPMRVVQRRELRSCKGWHLVSQRRLLSSHWRRWSVSGCEWRAEERGRERGKRRWKSIQGSVRKRTGVRAASACPRATRRWELDRKGHFEIWWGLSLVGDSTMIWYVATLIASVFSSRGTAAQGESKCSVSILRRLLLNFPFLNFYRQ